MKKNMISEFISRCIGNEKAALIYKKRGKFINCSFNNFYFDCLRMKSFLEENTSKEDNILVFSYPYSYLFYVAMFAGFMTGLNLVIFDSYNDNQKIKNMVESSSCNKVLVDNYTRFLGYKLPNTLQKINILNYKKYSCSTKGVNKDATITTFTSGTTGASKPIVRNLKFLEDQIELIKSNIKIESYDLVYGMLPMYTMLSLFLGNTTCICRDISRVYELNPTVLLTTIKSVLGLKKQLLSVKKCFLGGAILYSKEAKKISGLLPNADINYVYGASEGALIYQTKLNKYICNSFSFDEKVSGVNVSIVDPNKDGIGEITISGSTVISKDSYHYTGDYGKLVNNVLTIVGRKKYSSINDGFYNYLEDERIINENPKLIKGFSFWYKGLKYVVYEGEISFRRDEYIYIKFKKLPMDSKHQTKLDYSRAIEKIASYKS